MQYLNIADNDLLYAMTPNEYNRKIKGVMLRDVQMYENMTIQAIFNAQATNGKRITAKKLFDAERARQNILHPKEQKEKERASRDYTYLQRALAAMNQSKEGSE